MVLLNNDFRTFANSFENGSEVLCDITFRHVDGSHPLSVALFTRAILVQHCSLDNVSAELKRIAPVTLRGYILKVILLPS